MLHVENLCFEYDEGLKTIDHISFHVKKGSYTTILGHNGSGKSTIAKLVIGLLAASQGHIEVGGIPLSVETLNDVRKQ
ncbi:MAG TPA: energy-coupling factor ABC transporter ATP-binding protein, partial [Kandleria vitulina]|nr:energy-coupling factor ABC transporter ATP-binding protein [Kandleria vitulina]